MSKNQSTDGGQVLTLKSVERGKMVIPLMQNMEPDESKISLLKGLPSMIMQNGLAQTVAFLQSKDKYKDILKVFTTLLKKDKEKKSLLDEIIAMPEATDYMDMQKEAIEYAGWMKKLVQAFVKPAKEGDDQEGTGVVDV